LGGDPKKGKNKGEKSGKGGRTGRNQVDKSTIAVPKVVGGGWSKKSLDGVGGEGQSWLHNSKKPKIKRLRGANPQAIGGSTSGRKKN